MQKKNSMLKVHVASVVEMEADDGREMPKGECLLRRLLNCPWSITFGYISFIGWMVSGEESETNINPRIH